MDPTPSGQHCWGGFKLKLQAMDMNDFVAQAAGHTLAMQIQEMVDHAAHYLPAQGPVTSFVHHNTLHAFQQLDFSAAVKAGQRLLGCEPYLSERRFREELSRGRITDCDLDSVLREELSETHSDVIAGLDTRLNIRKAMLQHSLFAATRAELDWLIQETDALGVFRNDVATVQREQMIESTREWLCRLKSVPDRVRPEIKTAINWSAEIASVLEGVSSLKMSHWKDRDWQACCLRLQWSMCNRAVVIAPPPTPSEPENQPTRFQELVERACAINIDEWIHELLIKFSAAFLDQGFANWELPHRADGFWRAFVALFSLPGFSGDSWRRELSTELQKAQREQLDPLDAIAESMQELGIDAAQQSVFITQELLALPGFAGMIQQVAERSDRVFHGVPKSSLSEFLAARLILLRCALRHVARVEFGHVGPLANFRELLQQRVSRSDENGQINEHRPTQLAFVIFQLAQFLGWSPRRLSQLTEAEWSELLHEVDSFSSVERRHVFQLAYERHYRDQALSALLLHNSQEAKDPQQKRRPKFQIVCCIDDREESFRRYLEELEPACETFGMAGFFAVVMYFKGLADAHFTPLCPVIVRPQHYVREEAVFSLKKQEESRRRRRAVLGRWSHGFHLGSRTLAAGWIGTSLLGTLATIPLVARIVAPRLTSQLRQLFSSWIRPPQVTELHLERQIDPPGNDNGHLGYTVEEMANIVQRLLEDIGLTSNFSRLILVTGHGSSSMNNPHESAYNCGACAGARGGPNARAFTQMANDLRVRDVLRNRGLVIPTDTFFLGTYHNTCNDAFELFDLERVPITHRELVEETLGLIDEARARNAHERCRRFESADLSFTPEAALRHVEGRAQDLSQARPEYNHATNALCLVGRRAWSRGLFLDRRAFLASYDPTIDDEERHILTRILQAAVPVCGGISLEYYFSTVDNEGYGAGNKLPHNITSLLGVMTGAESDLRPGLSAQMVEIHEPMRLLFIVETTPEAMCRIVEKNPAIGELVEGQWVQLATYEAEKNELHIWNKGRMERFVGTLSELPQVADSLSWYCGNREHLGFAELYQQPLSQPDRQGS